MPVAIVVREAVRIVGILTELRKILAVLQIFDALRIAPVIENESEFSTRSFGVSRGSPELSTRSKAALLSDDPHMGYTSVR